MAEARSRLGDPATTAILLCECQEGIIGESSVLPELAAATAPLRAGIGEFTAAARRAGAQVVHATVASLPGGRGFKPTSVLMGSLRPKLANWVSGHPCTMPIPEVGLDPSDWIMPRHHGLAPTQHTELMRCLANAGITTVVVAGVSTNVAIPTVTNDLANNGFAVVIPADLVAGTDSAYTQQMFQHTLRMLATISSGTDLMAHWSSQEL
jgi:nicotinamidase-related amidase